MKNLEAFFDFLWSTWNTKLFQNNLIRSWKTTEQHFYTPFYLNKGNSRTHYCRASFFFFLDWRIMCVILNLNVKIINGLVFIQWIWFGLRWRYFYVKQRCVIVLKTLRLRLRLHELILGNPNRLQSLLFFADWIYYISITFKW